MSDDHLVGPHTHGLATGRAAIALPGSNRSSSTGFVITVTRGRDRGARACRRRGAMATTTSGAAKPLVGLMGPGDGAMIQRSSAAPDHHGRADGADAVRRASCTASNAGARPITMTAGRPPRGAARAPAGRASLRGRGLPLRIETPISGPDLRRVSWPNPAFRSIVERDLEDGQPGTRPAGTTSRPRSSITRTRSGGGDRAAFGRGPSTVRLPDEGLCSGTAKDSSTGGGPASPHERTPLGRQIEQDRRHPRPRARHPSVASAAGNSRAPTGMDPRRGRGRQLARLPVDAASTWASSGHGRPSGPLARFAARWAGSSPRQGRGGKVLRRRPAER